MRLRPGGTRAGIAGAAAVTVTLALNLARGYPAASLAAALTIALVPHRLWVRADRPLGVSEAERLAELDA